MSFHLAISSQRDPAEGTKASDERDTRSCVATVEITGDLSDESRRELGRRLEEVIAGSAQTVVVELIDVGAEAERLERFCSWVARMRAEGKPIHVAAHQPLVHERLKELADDPEWLLPYKSAETSLNRRALKVEGPSAAS